MAYRHRAELHGLGIEGEQAVGEQLAHTCEVFQCLGSLDGAQHTGDGTQHTSLRTGGHNSCGWRFLEHAAVAGRAGQMSECLAVEAEYAAVREGLASHDAGIVDEEFHGEVVRAIDDEVVLLNNIEGV